MFLKTQGFTLIINLSMPIISCHLAGKEPRCSYLLHSRLQAGKALDSCHWRLFLETSLLWWLPFPKSTSLVDWNGESYTQIEIFPAPVNIYKVQALWLSRRCSTAISEVCCKTPTMCIYLSNMKVNTHYAQHSRITLKEYPSSQQHTLQVLQISSICIGFSKTLE